jgi:hypothetical protein
MIGALATVGAAAIATAAPAAAGLAEPDPIFAAIEEHRAAVRAVKAAGTEIDRLVALADAAVGPRSIEVPNMLEPGSPAVTVSCWVDIEKYVSPETDAELYEHYRARLEEQRDAHAEYLREIAGDIDEIMNGPAGEECGAADELTEMVPTSLPGLFAVLIYINTAMIVTFPGLSAKRGRTVTLADGLEEEEPKKVDWRSRERVRNGSNMHAFLFRSYDLIVQSDEADLVRDVCFDIDKAQTKLKAVQRRLKGVQEQAAARVQLLTVAETKLMAAIVAALLSRRT